MYVAAAATALIALLVLYFFGSDRLRKSINLRSDRQL